jgi:hypothetical protein
MANTKVTKAVLANDAVGLDQLDISNDPTNGQALTYVATSNDLQWADNTVAGISSSADSTAITIDSSENVSIGTTATGAGGLALAEDINLTFSSDTTNSYANLFRQKSSAATVLAQGYKYSDTNNGFTSSIGSSWAKTAISQNYGTIRFYTDAAATTAVGTDVTPTERMRITSAGKVGVNTTTVPHGSVGHAMFAMDGANNDTDGPHVQYTTVSDDYPIFQQLNWGHDNISLNFDMYYDGTWRSSDAGSNYQIYKTSDQLEIWAESGITAGGTTAQEKIGFFDTNGRWHT